ncbi:hypothetical protein FRC12_017113 [Ceratobasidium sp. 428]|nr:hypothetical protein FRC09_007035 [Ceratobasidium sp. 395]KAG8795201.1 hypothetical protein FRC12_017113 [Ceratobasidium sp. 428]
MERFMDAPPIRRVGWRASNETIVDSRHESDACVSATDTERASVQHANSAPLVNDDPEVAADRAEGPRVTPVTPRNQNTSNGRNEMEGDSREIYWTARTSRTVEPVTGDEDINRAECITRSEPYIPERDDNDYGFESARTAILNWYDEVQCAEAGEENELPDLQWFRDHWSRSNYLSARRELTEEQDNRTHREEDIEVKAFLYEVKDNHVFSNNEYSQVLRNLREEARSSEPANASVRS